jgi:hypothetical protein
MIPRAIYQLNVEGRKIFCSVIKYTRFPDGYVSNMFLKVNLEAQRLVSLKTHDCHIIMQDLMPLALCRSLPSMVAIPLIRLCNYFKVLYGKVLDPIEIEKWEAEIPEILCDLEMIFSPSFFLTSWFILQYTLQAKSELLVQCSREACGQQSVL